jgi:hypothetical protein
LGFIDKTKQKWERLWMPKLQSGKTEIELERDKRYETNWVWYHTILAAELFLIIILLIGILIKI